MTHTLDLFVSCTNIYVLIVYQCDESLTKPICLPTESYIFSWHINEVNSVNQVTLVIQSDMLVNNEVQDNFCGIEKVSNNTLSTSVFQVLEALSFDSL